MKTANKLLTVLLCAGLSTVTVADENKEVRVMVDDKNGVITKNVTVNGRELSPDEIAEMEANGDININSADSLHGKKMIFVKADGSKSGNEDIEISINTDGDKITKKVIMNGKELSVAEIAELEANGRLKTVHLDANSVNVGSGHNVMVFKSDNVGADGKHEVHVETKVVHMDDDRATLGFMTNVKDDGWHVISVIEGSGAEDSGLQAGDIIRFIGDKDLTQKNNTLDIVKHKEGDKVDLEVLRGEELIYMSIEARKNNSIDMVVDVDNDFSWTTKLEGMDFDKIVSDGKNLKIMVMDGKKVGKTIDLKNFDVNLPDMLGNMNIFVTDGASTSKLLGKNHEMSSLSAGLSSYFGTEGGVLLTHVGDDNVFGFEDGDVIKSIAGVDTQSPKDVIKQLLKAKDQEKIKVKIVRHKRNKTLKYNK